MNRAVNGLPSRHVEHLLAAYTSGQLTARKAARVRRHLAECAACRERLSRYERVASDLRLALGSARPKAKEIDSWWQAIRTAPVRRTHSGARAALAPVLLTLLLLVVPVLAGGQRALPAHAGSTAASPALNTTLAPPALVMTVSAPAHEATESLALMATSPHEHWAAITPAPYAPTRDG
ncbi:MAG TPA: zf-HC2 domain-containing protein [Aggregatilineales bacterium]|nr:zf-HC2 domain-containing protein [Aggregatilineales bacterium]